MPTATPQGKGTVSPGSHRAPGGGTDVQWGDEPVLCYPSPAFGPKNPFPPVQKGELHWGRALGKERRTLGLKAGDEQGRAQLWELMWWWIPPPLSAPLSEPQAGPGSLPGVIRMLPAAALSALLREIHLPVAG